MSLENSDSDLEQGDTAPDFQLKSHKGEKVGLTDLNNYDGVLVVFMCNHCPFVKTQTEELRKLDEEFQSIAMLKRRAPPEDQKPSQGCSIKWK